MSNYADAKLLFLDIETSGVNYDTDVLYEVAAFTTDISGNIESKYEGPTLVGYSPEGLVSSLRNADDWIMTTHKKSGLFRDLVSAPVMSPESVATLPEMDDALCVWLDGLGLAQKPLLAGNSIAFDRRFIERDLPNFASGIHYRSMDCTSLLYFLKGLGIEVPYGKKLDSHRAEDDIIESIESYKTMRALVAPSVDEEPDMIGSLWKKMVGGANVL